MCDAASAIRRTRFGFWWCPARSPDPFRHRRIPETVLRAGHDILETGRHCGRPAFPRRTQDSAGVGSREVRTRRPAQITRQAIPARRTAGTDPGIATAGHPDHWRARGSSCPPAFSRCRYGLSATVCRLTLIEDAPVGDGHIVVPGSGRRGRTRQTNVRPCAVSAAHNEIAGSTE